jgi:CheY-like chemotaxis protein
MSLQDPAPVSKVLLVEDDPYLLSFMADLLGDNGLEVACASRGAEALAILEGGLSPCVLVTDINLSGEPDGLALARAVAERWPQIRLLIVSGECRPAHGQYPDQAIFFTKPFAGGALVAMIRSDDWRPDAGTGAKAAPADRPAPAKLPHEEVYVRLGLSGVHGIGVFAIRPIAAGACIFPSENRPIRWVSVEELERSAPSEAARRFYADFGIRRGDRIGCPQDFAELTPSWYLNAPPAGVAANVRSDPDFTFRAARDIAAGEELLIDYGSFNQGAD